MNNTKVIIIGSEHHNLYGTIRCFGESGETPIVIIYGCKDSYILHSKYINEKYIVNTENDALLLLLRNKKNWNHYCIITCADSISSTIDLHMDQLANNYHFFNCGKQGVLTLNMNKLKQAEQAEYAGLKTPMSYNGLPTENMECNISYPRILKPLESIHGGKHIVICNTPKEYAEAVNQFSHKDHILVQEYIAGQYEIVIVGLSINGDILIPGYAHKHRNIDGGTTFSTIKTISGLPGDVIKSCSKLVSNIKYEGLFGIEVIKQDENYFFIEINLRIDATTYAFSVAGVNLPLLYYKCCKNSERILCLKSDIREINAMVEIQDFVHVLKWKICFFKWKKQLNSCECRYMYSKNDPEPYKISKNNFIKMLIHKIIIIWG